MVERRDGGIKGAYGVADAMRSRAPLTPPPRRYETARTKGDGERKNATPGEYRPVPLLVVTIVRSGGDEPAEASGRSTPDTCARSRSAALQFVSGAAIGVLGGMIGLGGAEFRLPVLIALFGFAALHAIILNKAMSLIVVLTALPARLPTVPFTEVAAHWSVIANLLGGTLLGAWLGARWATRMRSALLHHILAVLLVLMATVLAWSHFGRLEALALAPVTRTIVGIVAGIGIGLVAALMGVAGGELLIPALVALLLASSIKVWRH